jgi:hypothetical protein
MRLARPLWHGRFADEDNGLLAADDNSAADSHWRKAFSLQGLPGIKPRISTCSACPDSSNETTKK